MITGDLTLKYNGAYDVADPTTPRCRLDGTQNGQPLTIITDRRQAVHEGRHRQVRPVVGLRLGRAARPRHGAARSADARQPDRVLRTWPHRCRAGHGERSRGRALARAGRRERVRTQRQGTTTVDLWLDSTDLLRQVSYSLTSGGIASTTTTVTITYGDFNSAVAINGDARRADEGGRDRRRRSTHAIASCASVW
jgi:hypothetical protein